MQNVILNKYYEIGDLFIDDWLTEIVEAAGLSKVLTSNVLPLLRELKVHGTPGLWYGHDEAPGVVPDLDICTFENELDLPIWSNLDPKERWRLGNDTLGNPPVAIIKGKNDDGDSHHVHPGELGRFDVAINEIVYVLAPNILHNITNGDAWAKGIIGYFTAAVDGYPGDDHMNHFDNEQAWTYKVSTVPSSISFVKGSDILIGFFLGSLSYALGTALYEYGTHGVYGTDEAANSFYPAMQECWLSYLSELERIF